MHRGTQREPAALCDLTERLAAVKALRELGSNPHREGAQSRSFETFSPHVSAQTLEIQERGARGHWRVREGSHQKSPGGHRKSWKSFDPGGLQDATRHGQDEGIHLKQRMREIKCPGNSNAGRGPQRRVSSSEQVGAKVEGQRHKHQLYHLPTESALERQLDEEELVIFEGGPVLLAKVSRDGAGEGFTQSQIRRSTSRCSVHHRSAEHFPDLRAKKPKGTEPEKAVRKEGDGSELFAVEQGKTEEVGQFG